MANVYEELNRQFITFDSLLAAGGQQALRRRGSAAALECKGTIVFLELYPCA